MNRRKKIPLGRKSRIYPTLSCDLPPPGTVIELDGSILPGELALKLNFKTSNLLKELWKIDPSIMINTQIAPEVVKKLAEKHSWEVIT